MTTSFPLGENWRGHFTFFLFPSGLHISTNVVLFVLTAIHYNKCVKNDDSPDKKTKFLADRAKYMMNIKLFFVMGVTWSLEILSTLVKQQAALWYVTDTFNILQGVFVFIIFVCKAKVWDAIMQRLGGHSNFLHFCLKTK